MAVIVPMRQNMNGDRGRFTAKLAIPRTAVPVMPRPRMSTRLDQATAARVTLVRGPAGAGKTIACAEWAKEGAGRRRVGWLCTDRGDNEPTRLRACILGALGTEQAGAADGDVEGFLDRLTALVPRDGEPVYLVLDDVHEISAPAVLEDLDSLILHAPDTLRLILSGRRVPRLRHLARLRVSGELAEIDGAELACTAEECAQYCGVLGVSPEVGRVLFDHTRGWMAGIRLAGDSFLADYFRDEVLHDQTGSDRDFLLRTCVAGTLTGPLADVLTGGDDGARTLDRLSRETGFVERGDGGYRYHPLFRDLLLAEAERDLPEELPGLRVRAARWYAGEDRPREGLRCAVDAGDPELVTRLLRADRTRAAGKSDHEELEAGVREAGSEAARGTYAFLLGLAHLREGAVPQAREALRIADGALRSAPSPSILPGLRVRARAWRAVAEARYGALEAAVALTEPLSRGGRAAGRVPAGAEVRAVTVAALARVAWARDDLIGAKHLLDEDPRFEPFPGEPPVGEELAWLRARVLLAEGDVQGARAVSDGLDAEIALRIGDPDRAASALTLTGDPIVTGYLHLICDDPRAALRAVTERLDGAGTLPDRIGALLVAGCAHRRLGAADTATTCLGQALELAAAEEPIRVFLQGGQTVRSALTALTSPGPFRNRVLSRFDRQPAAVLTARPAPAGALTECELAVVRFLPSHMTNEEIADGLFLSVNTVKTHLRAAYRKLGVGSRRAAIAEAARRGLL
ncbi:LuxR C-terminal-related transcriptional regulator [Rhizohabitans arisaemae]|uniref:LuxR C-terminal-related transcriptional regulator n=1 Tax=Rhizohabitans arisaemae TaxID=2720610 RepID=UPI0024B1D772|nr:LuxR C-terminal-related transcriptional regulator [Rhizohabitans arisaemae]